jgi:hypothetical protein
MLYDIENRKNTEGPLFLELGLVGFLKGFNRIFSYDKLKQIA